MDLNVEGENLPIAFYLTPVLGNLSLCVCVCVCVFGSSSLHSLGRKYW